MKKLSLLLALSVTIVVAGCAKQSEPPKGRASSQTSVLGVEEKDVKLKNYDPASLLDLANKTVESTSSCANPIGIDQSKYQVITTKETMPLGKFDLQEIQLHAVYTGGAKAFTALSKEDEAFSFELQCKDDGALTEEAAEEAIIETLKKSDAFGGIANNEDRAEAFLALSFKDGDLSNLVPGMKADQVLMVNERVGKDAQMSVMPYAVSESQINILVHIELNNGDGQIRHLYGTATYVKASESSEEVSQ